MSKLDRIIVNLFILDFLFGLFVAAQVGIAALAVVRIVEQL